MQFIDATRCLGRVGILASLLLAFLIAADSTLACPGSKTRVVYRTRATNGRMISPIATTVITYGGPGSSARCGDNLTRTRGVRYVAVGRNAYPSASRYVAVRSSEAYYPVRRTRSVAVRNVDYDDAARYVMVRRQPVYVDSGTRYVAVRRQVPRVRYVAVRDFDDDDYDYAPRYVAVRRQPVYAQATRYVAVRNIDSDYGVAPAKYIAVRNVGNSCACARSLESSLDEIETRAPRHVVVKSDYLAGTQEVIVPESSYDDTAYLPVETPARTYDGYVNAAYIGETSNTYVPASYVESPCARAVALRTCSGDPAVRTIAYAPAYNDDDFYDQAILDNGGTTYVAANDIEDACLSRVAVQAPMEMTTRTISYVPVEDVDDDAFLSGSDTTYIAADDPSPMVSYVPVVDDDAIDADVTYVAASDVDSCSCPVALGTYGYEVQDINAARMNYAPVETVSYVPAETVDIPAAEITDVGTVGYVPAESVDYVDTADTDACECPISETGVITEVADVGNASMVMADESDSDLVTLEAPIAGENGYRDGFTAGKLAALNGDGFSPDSGDFQAATNGYVSSFADEDGYKNAYRDSYLEGYTAGFESIDSSS